MRECINGVNRKPTPERRHVTPHTHVITAAKADKTLQPHECLCNSQTSRGWTHALISVTTTQQQTNERKQKTLKLTINRRPQSCSALIYHFLFSFFFFFVRRGFSFVQQITKRIQSEILLFKSNTSLRFFYESTLSGSIASSTLLPS